MEADYALGLLSSTTERSWYKLIPEGSTITMEAWDMKDKPNADQNYAWGALPANTIPWLKWGISPKTPGPGVVSINPQLSTQQYTKIKLPFKNGAIAARFTSNDGQTKTYMFTLDGDLRAELNIEKKKIKSIIFNGKTLKVKKDKPIVLSRGIYFVNVTDVAPQPDAFHLQPIQVNM